MIPDLGVPRQAGSCATPRTKQVSNHPSERATWRPVCGPCSL